MNSFKDGELIKHALEAEAIGFLLKDVSANELARELRAAYARRDTLSPEVAQVIVQNASRTEAITLALRQGLVT